MPLLCANNQSGRLGPWLFLSVCENRERDRKESEKRYKELRDRLIKASINGTLH